jgi:hypothetical protein
MSQARADMAIGCKRSNAIYSAFTASRVALRPNYFQNSGPVFGSFCDRAIGAVQLCLARRLPLRRPNLRTDMAIFDLYSLAVLTKNSRKLTTTPKKLTKHSPHFALAGNDLAMP